MDGLTTREPEDLDRLRGEPPERGGDEAIGSGEGGGSIVLPVGESPAGDDAADVAAQERELATPESRGDSDPG